MIRAHVLCCGGTGCTSSGSPKIQAAFQSEIEKNGLAEEVKVVQTGCFGLCALGPVVIVYPDGTFYSNVTVEDVESLHRGTAKALMLGITNPDITLGEIMDKI